LFVSPTINIEAQPLIRLNSVRAFILQRIGPNLVDDTDAAALLLLID
jgi:hypothetical protein